ncbi:MAG TPA: DUF6714 family protein [Myxococcota bacterium]|jgi:hypothetical protein|nr:DUF6714 family protein [Myxococcota bacterium]
MARSAPKRGRRGGEPDEAVRRLEAQIRRAFARTPRPFAAALRDSNEGVEPFLVEKVFKNAGDWPALTPAFLDRAPEGYSSALSFLSSEGFRYFLPAYLIADLHGRLERQTPFFHLVHGLDDATHAEPVNRRRFGPRTWLDVCRHQFSVFTPAEARAIVAYLRHVARRDSFERPAIQQALRRYWLARAHRPRRRPQRPRR